MGWLLAAAAACGCFCAIAFGTFVPLRDAQGVEYLFAWPGASTLTALALSTLTALSICYLIVIRLCRRRNPGRAGDARAGRWLAPLAGLSCVALGILPAVPGVGVRAAPVAYLLYDLRWWWLIALAGWTVVRADALLGQPLATRVHHVASLRSPGGELRLELLLVAVVCTWAIATTPHLRFIGALHGDEPKYLRYCEIWYQGGGADISQKALFADEPLDSPPRVGRAFVGVLRASLEEAGDFAADLRQFAANPRGFRWNRVAGIKPFVGGKHGGVYEIYQPGLSLILFPGYFIDRYLLGLNAGSTGEFPDDLPMTSLVMLLTFGGCAIALFRLLRHALGDQGLAWIWAAIGTMTLPTTAFAFQFYPELPAAILVLTVTTFVVFARAPSAGASAAAGAAAAALVWLHPRFLLVSGCFLVAGVLRTRSAARRTFIAGFGAVLLSVMCFDYNVTGSFLPTSRWDATNPGGTLHGSAVPLNLVAYALDWQWGLFPHAPILLMLLPGLAVLTWRAPREGALLVCLALALTIPAAGHTLHAAGGTPGRLVLAVVPLAVWPIAVLVREIWRFPLPRVESMALVVMSLQAGLAYNWSHKKHIGPIHDVSASGWKPNLAFPGVRDNVWHASWRNVMLFAVILVVLVALSAAAVAYARRRQAAPPRRTPWWMAPATAAVLVVTCIAATSANGVWYTDSYLMAGATAYQQAAQQLVTLGRCNVCFTSRRAAVDWTSIEPNGARGLDVSVDTRRRPIVVHVAIETPERVPAFGRMRVEYGDGTSTPWAGVVSAADFRHTYARSGTYVVTAWLQLRDGSLRSERATVTVSSVSGA